MSIDKKKLARISRRKRVRKKVRGTQERPRLNVFKSARHIYAQLVDDIAANTLLAASSLSPELKGSSGANKAGAKAVGELIAKKAKEAGIEQVVFDRNGFLFHGRVKELAEAAREGGLKF